MKAASAFLVVSRLFTSLHAGLQSTLQSKRSRLRFGKNQVRAALPEEDTLSRLSELFKVCGDGTRIRILYVLFEAEVCVCDLSKLLGLTQSAVSHQLRILKQARLIKSRRDGKTVFYSLSDDHVSTLLRQGTEHISISGD